MTVAQIQRRAEYVEQVAIILAPKFSLCPLWAKEAFREHALGILEGRREVASKWFCKREKKLIEPIVRAYKQTMRV